MSGGLFEEILSAPDRDACPGARPVLSFRDDDDAQFLAAIEERAKTRVTLERRGVYHGEIAELDDIAQGPGLPEEAVLEQRWHTARPIVCRSIVGDPGNLANEIAQRSSLHDELKEPGGLRRFLKTRREQLEPHFAIQGRPLRLFDEERDIERVGVTWKLDPRNSSSPRAKDLWIKSAWLSSLDDDESLRLRVSHGRELDDDASRDLRRHKRVAELAEILLPEATLVSGNDAITSFIDGLVGAPTFFSQHIAYWNGAGGGALFHHDAFDEEIVGGQRGVCYTQLSGRTAWLALSIEDLARRVIEFGEYLADGELAWVKKSAFKGPDAFERFLKMCKRFKRVTRELARPACGSLGEIVNRGPEFTSLLADAGHAFVLHPGDAILLPNHGFEATAMHSVFGASTEPAYGISMAIRESDPEEILPGGEEPRERRPDHRNGKGRRNRGGPKTR